MSAAMVMGWALSDEGSVTGEGRGGEDMGTPVPCKRGWTP
jgi:hypothetical protein